MKGKPYREVAYRVMQPFVGNAFDEMTFRRLIAEAYASFDAADVAPLKPLDDNLQLLELFHGPTSAFKDFGARFLAACLRQLEPSGVPPRTVLVAARDQNGGANPRRALMRATLADVAGGAEALS